MRRILEGKRKISVLTIFIICFVLLADFRLTGVITNAFPQAEKELSSSSQSVISTQQTIQKFVPIIYSKDRVAHPVDKIFTENNNTVTQRVGWLFEYIEWHNQIRRNYSDTNLFDHPDVPHVRIVYNCGKNGLSDRLKSLHQALFTAYLEKHVLLYKWDGSIALETFLLPNLLNWTVPNHQLSKNNCHSGFAKGGEITFREVSFYSSSQNVVKNIPDSISIAWHAMFIPSPLLQSKLDTVSSSLGLVAGHYNAVHCRVRHPAHFKNVVTDVIDEDFNGANYTGKQRELAINTAIHAIKCTNWISQHHDNATLPIYFYSDAEQLVNSVIRQKPPNDALEKRLHNLSLSSNAVGRVNNEPIRHIGDDQNGSIDSYLVTFVDVYIASSARCLALGVGNFAYLAARISGTDCLVTHEKINEFSQQKWGMIRSVKVQSCGVKD